MAVNRDRARVILFQIRDAKSGQIEYESFLRASKLSREQLIPVDMFAGAPSAAILEGVDGVIIAGSRFSVFEDVPHLAWLMETIRTAKEKRIPVLGVCFGAQLLATVFGGKVVRDEAREEFGTFDIACTDDALADILFADAPDCFPAQCAHHDRIVSLPPAAIVLASSDRCPVQAFVLPGTGIYGVQFHPERGGAEAENLIVKFIDRIVLQK